MEYCFSTFSVETTNIFPLANSTKGGQLVTEFNLKSRESVSYYESVKYSCGPSYAHAKEDFAISPMLPAGEYFPDDNAFSSSILRIAPGRAVIDGHYVENFSEMAIDIAVKNKLLYAEGKDLIGGDLAVGLKAMYSTEETMMGAMLCDSERDRGKYYDGIQVVIIPVDEVMLPTTKKQEGDRVIDCGLPENRSKVNMHLLLGTFTYFNGTISHVANNYPGKCQMLPATRIGRIDDVISDTYVNMSGLDEAKIYAFAGKGVGSVQGEKGTATGKSTWCDVTNALVPWTERVEFTTEQPAVKTAQFLPDVKKSEVVLHLPHKQVEGAGYTLHDKAGKAQYFKPSRLVFPSANYANETPGAVDKWYTRCIKNELKSLKDVNLMHMTNGKLLAYLDKLDTREDLPPINPRWLPGDYILVHEDYSVIEDAADPSQAAPSTMYIILPGVVTEISSTGSNTVPHGVQLAETAESCDTDPGGENGLSKRNDYWELHSDTPYRGRVNTDYFTLHCDYVTGETSQPRDFYYTVTKTDGKLSYSNAVLLTAQVPFATESMVGGFLNVPADTTDAGYVYLDETGHLRLLDYALLRSGTLAYQLGEDYTVPSGVDIPTIQSYLDEYVNQRIAFPNAKQIQSAENPNIIDITITLPKPDGEGEDGGELNIYDIDSRFNTAVRINILGEADDKVVINVSDCAKVIINPSIEGHPTINLYRSNLCYNATVLNRLSTIADMQLWYEKLREEDPNLTVEGMTVRLVKSTTEYNAGYSMAAAEYWSPTNVNDFHFKVALQSLSFTSSGYISGCTILVANDTTANVVDTGKFVLHDTNFLLPQGTFLYPERRFTYPIKVTGSFIHAYKSNDQKLPSYCIQKTDFSIKTQYYEGRAEYLSDEELSITNGLVPGEAAFLVDASVVNCDKEEDIDVWNKGEYHVFSGKLIQ